MTDLRASMRRSPARRGAFTCPALQNARMVGGWDVTATLPASSSHGEAGDDQVASIEKRTRNGKISWRAMYREPDGTQRSRSFPRRVDAERFLTTVEHSKMVGSYLDPSLARV